MSRREFWIGAVGAAASVALVGCVTVDSFETASHRTMLNWATKRCINEHQCISLGDDLSGQSSASRSSDWKERRDLDGARRAYAFGCSLGDGICCRRLVELHLAGSVEEERRYRTMASYYMGDERSKDEIAKEEDQTQTRVAEHEQYLSAQRTREKAERAQLFLDIAGAVASTASQASQTIAAGHAPVSASSVTASVPGNAEMAQMKKNINATLAQHDQKVAQQKAAQQATQKAQLAERANQRAQAYAQAQQDTQKAQQARLAEQENEREQQAKEKAKADEDAKKQRFSACMARITPETIPERGDGFGPAITHVHSARAMAQQCQGKWTDCLGPIKSELTDLKRWAKQVQQVGNEAQKLPSVGRPDCSVDDEKVADVDFWCWEMGGSQTECLKWLDAAGKVLECAAATFHWNLKAQAAVDYEEYQGNYEANCRTESR